MKNINPNNSPITAGIDLSLSATGVVLINSRKKIILKKVIKTKKLRGMERLLFIKQELLNLLIEHKVSQCAIEGYSFGSNGRALFNIGELGGVVRLALHENSIHFFDIPPTSLKAFITDNGGADKEMVIQAINKDYGILFKDNNEADAYGLALMLNEFRGDIIHYTKKGGAKKIREYKKGIKNA